MDNNRAHGATEISRWSSARRLFVDISPVLAVGVGYALLKYVLAEVVTAPRVVSCGLRALDLALFSVRPNTTVGEALAQAHTPLFDVLSAVPYAAFLYIALGYGAYLYFRDRERMRRYVLALAVANCIAFAFWLLLPAAPPWYVHAHGCSVVMPATPSAAGLNRVDALFGMHYFGNFYARASQIFGAMPSLHCAYPLLGLLSAWKVSNGRFRLVHGVYCIWMALAALYLDHHWLVDVIAGWCVAVVASEIAKWWLRDAKPAPLSEVAASDVAIALPLAGAVAAQEIPAVSASDGEANAE
jgi:membrane-associated phospholipid phosphatase